MGTHAHNKQSDDYIMKESYILYYVLEFLYTLSVYHAQR